jgi:alpha-galactosidase
MLKEENYQLKNEISELKNAFDLNRDILKIISTESKSTNPRIQMLYQIINRLTSINNQIMINTA